MPDPAQTCETCKDIADLDILRCHVCWHYADERCHVCEDGGDLA